VAGILKNMKKIFLIFFAILFTVGLVSAPLAIAQTNSQDTENSAKRNYQRIIPLSSPIYREMDRLYILAGKSRPSLARPWSADEAKKIMEALPQSLFDSVPADSLTIIKREIEFGNERTGARKAAYKISPEINIEGYFQANNDRKKREHGYEERQPLLLVPFEGWFFTSLFMNLEIELRQEHAIADLANNYTNVGNPFGFDWHFPFRSFLSIGGEHWNFQFGRDKVSWGPGIVSNMIISDYPDFFNIIRFTTYWSRFKFTTVYMGLDPWLTDDEIRFKENNPRGFGGYDPFNELFKAFLANRLEFRVQDNFSLAITEAILFGDKYLNITELMPVFILHSHFTPQYSNSIISIEADYTPFSGLNIYLQFAADEVQLVGEGGRPRALGYLGGVTYIKPTFDGFLSFNLEAAFTDPFLYNRWHPNGRITNRRRIWSYHSDAHEHINKPIGYRYGPDAVILYAAAQFEKPDKYLVGINIKYRLLGEMNDSLDRPGTYWEGINNDINNDGVKSPYFGRNANRLRTPTGTVERNMVLGLYGKLHLTDSISLASNIYYIHINNYGNIQGHTMNDLEFALSVGFKF